MKTITMLGMAVALTACAAQNLNPENIHLTTTNYLTDIRATDTIRDGKIVVNITGKTYEDTTFYYRVQWFDANGMAIDSILSRPTMSKVRRESPFNWTVVAPSTKAASYQVYVADRPIEQ